MVSDYTKQDCISALQRAANELDKSPTTREYRSLDITPSIQVIWDKFDSFNEAKIKAGLETNLSSDLNMQPGKPNIIDMSEKEWKKLDKKERYRKRKQAKWAKYKVEHGCSNCGYDEHPSAIEWHHVGGRDGLTVSDLIAQTYGEERISKEIDKCILLCSNCHNIETHGDLYLV